MLAYRKGRGIPLALISQLTSWLLARQGAYGVRNADHIVCSNQTDVLHLTKHGVPADRITRHFSGVSREFLECMPAQVAENRTRLLFLGAWIERKGILDLTDAFATLANAYPAITLTLAGTILSAKQVLAAFPSHVRPRVRVIENIAGTDALIRLYRAHSIFLLPSYFEGQPLALIEAAAVGLAPVVTDIGGSRDFVEDSKNGFIVPVGSSQAIADRVKVLLDNPQLTAAFGAASRLRASQHTWSASAERLLVAYGELAARARGYLT
jgi:glycosyltransferase involved in cell wall biosynthesis